MQLDNFIKKKKQKKHKLLFLEKKINFSHS